IGARPLPPRHARLRQHPKGLAEPPAVLQHVGRIIAHMQPEIKAMERMKAYTAAALGEAVHDAPLKPRLHLPHGDPAQSAPHQPVPAHSRLTSFCTSPSSAVKSRNSRYTLAKRTYATSSMPRSASMTRSPIWRLVISVSPRWRASRSIDRKSVAKGRT